MGLSIDVVGGPDGRLARVWTAACDSPTDFSSLAAVHPGIGFMRIGGVTTVHLRGPATQATTLSCPRDAEYFGADFRLGTFLPAFPPARLADLHDVVLPTLPDGRILLDGRAWEMPTPPNVDIFVNRLERAGLLAFDPLVEELRYGEALGTVPERTAQSRFVRAVGLSRRKLRLIQRARRAARMLRAGEPIADVVNRATGTPRTTRSCWHPQRLSCSGGRPTRCSLPKYVASRTLTDATWNAEILQGDAIEAVSRLKESGEGTLLKYGTGSFSRALLEGGQLDELHLWVYPFIAGSGEGLLPGIATTHLDLVQVTEVGNGAVVLTYAPRR